MRYKIKIEISAFLFLLMFALSYCNQQKSTQENQKQESEYIGDEKRAIDTLKSRNLYNYLDSAYLYTYIYFGGGIIKRCGAVNIDSVLPSVSNRRIICQDLILRKVRFIPDSSIVLLSLVPLVNDSILSCDMVEGAQLPHEVMFNYNTKRFIQFVYDENSFLRVNANPFTDYENGLKKVIESEKLVPHKKFKELLHKTGY